MCVFIKLASRETENIAVKFKDLWLEFGFG